MEVPRPEYPRPQFRRGDWLCLNGAWQFEIDETDDGLRRGLLERDLAGRIVVPFCPESPLSGVGHTDFMPAVWYRHSAAIPADWAGRRILLHFQAVDYEATVWVNGVEVGRHRGGFTPFTCDLAGVAAPGETVTLVVRARDDPDHAQPRGKQCHEPENRGCLYTRTTGIWQTVWMEPVPDPFLKRPRITPDTANGVIRLEQPIVGPRAGLTLRATLRDAAGEVCTAQCPADADFTPRLDLAIPESRRRLWSPADPHLYNLTIELTNDDATIDRFDSYAGLRSVTIDGPRVLLNGEPLFQRLVLDQGYYPDGIMTASSDEALRRDIQLSQAVGFNGARLHQKVFEERFLYHADRLGYLVWGEFADWGQRRGAARAHHPDLTPAWVTQWLEALHRDYSHPSIIGWCALNESVEPITDRVSNLDDVTRALFLAARAADRTRPILDASGYAHRVPEADIYDCHDYEQDPAVFATHHARIGEGRPHHKDPDDEPWSAPYGGQPFFVSEFGGIWWNPDAKEGDPSWGYGERPATVDEFYERFEALVTALLDNPHLFGYCYTQLTDVYQEQNGLYTFDRRPKFDPARLRRIQEGTAR